MQDLTLSYRRTAGTNYVSVEIKRTFTCMNIMTATTLIANPSPALAVFYQLRGLSWKTVQCMPFGLLLQA